MAVQSRVPAAGLTAAAIPSARVDQMVVFAGIFALLMAVAPKLLADPDTQWHIAVGAEIWRRGEVPLTDTFSHTFAGQPWIAKEWLSQVLLFAAKQVGGWTGVAVATGLAAAFLFSAMFGWLSAHLRPLAALTLTLVALVLLAPHLLARPHVFAFLPLFLWSRALVDALDRERPPPVWALGVLVLWANLHGSFTIAYPIAGLLAAEALLRAPESRRMEAALRWGLFGAAAIGAGCVTPYGAQCLLVTFTLFGSGESLPFIDEWRPIGWTVVGFVAGGASLLFAACLVADGRGNAARIALLALLTFLFIRHSRFLDVFAIVGPLLVAAPIARRFPDQAPRHPDPASRWPAISRGLLIGLLFAGLGAAGLRKPSPDPAVTPRAALAAARAAGLTGPVYNSYNFGGFLIAEGVPTFIDGRTDQLFLGGFISTLMSAAKADDPAAFFRFLAERDVTWALVENDGRDARHFDASPGWTRVHKDGDASVYRRTLRGSLAG